jgi:hypothetical protein
VLYREAWSDPLVRWVLSTVPTAMVFDDHDVHDDWNTSRAWRRSMQGKPWWAARIEGGLMAYWLYQHLGNLSPAELARDELWAALKEVDDGEELMRAHARRADAEAEGGKGVRWSYRRDYGDVRLLVLDSRGGRVLDVGDRSMVDAAEWEWIVEQTRDCASHLLLASSLPVLLPPALHDLEGWNEAVCDGAWGRRAARAAEVLRQGADLEHWAAFRSSWDRLMRLVAEVGAGRCGPAPSTITFLGGDVHFSYVAQAHFPASLGVTSAVHQAVCSPVRNPSTSRSSSATGSPAPGPAAGSDAGWPDLPGCRARRSAGTSTTDPGSTTRSPPWSSREARRCCAWSRRWCSTVRSRCSRCTRSGSRSRQPPSTGQGSA